MDNNVVAISIMAAISLVVLIVFLISTDKDDTDKNETSPKKEEAKKEDSPSYNNFINSINRIKNNAEKVKESNKDKEDDIDDEEVDRIFEELESKRRERINSEINEVCGWIGVNEWKSLVDVYDELSKGNENEAANEIARMLKLPMKVELIQKEKQIKEGNHSRLGDVVVGGLPNYGSDNLKLYTCRINVYPGYNTSPDRFIYVIAHEICHYLLQTLRPAVSKDKDREERMTDIAVIFAGFKSSYYSGRTNEYGTAGYLSNDEADYICKKYEEMLSERKKEYKEIKNEFLKLKAENREKIIFYERCGKLLKNKTSIIIEKSDLESINKCLSTIDANKAEKIQEYIKKLSEASESKEGYLDPKEDKRRLMEMKKMINDSVLPDPDDVAILMKYTD